jgi:hypothetical protein
MLRPDVQKITDTLSGLPLKKRLAALTYSVIVDPRAVSSALNVLEVVSIIARHLAPEQRAEIAHQLRLAAADLDARSYLH